MVNPVLFPEPPSASPIKQGPPNLHWVVEQLCHSNSDFLRGPRKVLGRRALPSKEALHGIVQDIRAAMFPWHFGGSDVSPKGLSYYVGHTLESALTALEKQVRIGMLLDCTHHHDRCEACEMRAAELVQNFAERLPEIRRMLGSDACAALSGDPAATSLDEVVFCYPGMTAMVHHRIAHELHALGAQLIGRIISQLAHSETGIDIHPAASIGPSFFVDHGTGVVIGETCVIGARVRVYQGVTLGARSFPKNEKGELIKGAKRHPCVEDDVVIYAGATVLGPITLRRGAVVGGNVWLTRDVPADSKVAQAQAPDVRVTSA